MHSPAVIYELPEARIRPIRNPQIFPFDYLGCDVCRIQPIIRHLAEAALEEECTKGENVNFLVVLALLEELGCHVRRRASILELALAQVGLQTKLFQHDHELLP